jgi:hypothetical protein
VLGDRRLRNPGAIGQSPHGLFAVAGQPLQDRPASRIGKGLEEGVGRGAHAKPITCQVKYVVDTTCRKC